MKDERTKKKWVRQSKIDNRTNTKRYYKTITAEKRLHLLSRLLYQKRPRNNNDIYTNTIIYIILLFDIISMAFFSRRFLVVRNILHKRKA